ncbi:MAG: F0F1 ATP synthase subunit B [Ruminococcaceae bacterium]|jgi:F-type H+-transporting ATPase subunit b|nr:F0F1 ATP synthase subunit B [Oscillospiraceae bacterium]
MEGLDVSKLPIDLLLNILNIILLFVITRFLVYKPVKKFLQERKDKIEAQKQEAADKLKEAEDIKAQYSSLIAEAETNARQAVLNGEAEARKQATEIIDRANREAEDIKKTASLEAQKEKEATLGSMKNDVAALAVSISEKILSREITDKDNERIVESFLNSGDNE